MVIDKSVPLHTILPNAMMDLASMDGEDNSPEALPLKFNKLENGHSLNILGSRKSGFSMEATGQ